MGRARDGGREKRVVGACSIKHVAHFPEFQTCSDSMIPFSISGLKSFKLAVIPRSLFVSHFDTECSAEGEKRY